MKAGLTIAQNEGSKSIYDESVSEFKICIGYRSSCMENIESARCRGANLQQLMASKFSYHSFGYPSHMENRLLEFLLDTLPMRLQKILKTGSSNQYFLGRVMWGPLKTIKELNQFGIGIKLNGSTNSKAKTQ